MHPWSSSIAKAENYYLVNVDVQHFGGSDSFNYSKIEGYEHKQACFSLLILTNHKIF